MDLREMDGRLRELWRAKQSGGIEAEERYVHELQRQLKHAYVLVVNTNTWYGRHHTPPLLSQQFNKVQTAWNLLTQYGRKPFRLGQDEDAFFTATAHPELPMMVINAFNENQRQIELGGLEFHIDPDNMDDNEFYLTNYNCSCCDGGHDMRLVIKEALDDPPQKDYGVKRLARIMTDTDVITGNPVEAWWNNYGSFSNNPIDPPARAIIEKLNLNMGEHTGGVIDDLDLDDDYLDESLTARQRWLAG